jgi:hypothetical protein
MPSSATRHLLRITFILVWTNHIIHVLVMRCSWMAMVLDKLFTGVWIIVRYEKSIALFCRPTSAAHPVRIQWWQQALFARTKDDQECLYLTLASVPDLVYVKISTNRFNAISLAKREAWTALEFGLDRHSEEPVPCHLGYSMMWLAKL